MGLDRSSLRWGEYGVNWGSPQAMGDGYRLVGWWPEALFDLVASRHAGPTNGPRRAPGLRGNTALACDGTNDYLAFSSTGLGAGSSIFAWVRPVDVSTGDRRFWAPNAGATGGTVRQVTTTLEALNTGGSMWQAIVSGLTTQWQHVGAVYLAAGTCTGYRNGAAGSNVASTTPTFWQSQAWTFGANYGGFGAYFGGCVADIRVYRGVVPDSVIREMCHPDTRFDLWEPHGGRRTVRGPALTHYTLSAESGTFTLTGQSASLEVGRVVAAASGSFALTGQSASLAATRALSAAAGSFALTGQAATLKAARTLSAVSGSFTLTGQAVTLRHGRILGASAGSFTLTGQTVALLVGRKLTASAGSYTLAGQAPALLAGRMLSVASGSFALTGQTVSLLAGRKLSASAGSYALSGQDAGLYRGYAMTATAGAFALTGQVAALLAARTLTASAGVFTITGQAATLTVGAAPAAAARSLALAGRIDVPTLAGRVDVPRLTGRRDTEINLRGVF